MRWRVSTDLGDYEVWAQSRDEAERKVYFLTNGRARNISARRA